MVALLVRLGVPYDRAATLLDRHRSADLSTYDDQDALWHLQEWSRRQQGASPSYATGSGASPMEQQPQQQQQQHDDDPLGLSQHDQQQQPQQQDDAGDRSKVVRWWLEGYELRQVQLPFLLPSLPSRITQNDGMSFGRF